MWPFRGNTDQLEAENARLRSDNSRLRGANAKLTTKAEELQIDLDRQRGKFTAQVYRANPDRNHEGNEWRVRLIPNSEAFDGQVLRGFNFSGFNVSFDQAYATAAYTEYKIDQVG